MNGIKYLTKLDQIGELSDVERSALKKVTEKFVFRTNDYYRSLIDWDNPDDPIRRIVIPDIEEIEEWGGLDASGESMYTTAPGLQHKYERTALLLVTDVCGGYCRFCFRKRLFLNGCDEIARDVTEGIEYIRKHEKITNVLLSGGDPLMLSTNKLERIISQIREIEHVRIIRIGTKMPAFNPYRIINDPSLPEMIRRYSTDQKRIYLMVQFNHPNEITDAATESISHLIKAGAIIANQTPMIRGVNDDPKTLSELFKKLSFIGVVPYYVFQCRPTSGNRTFVVPVEEAYEIFHRAQMDCSGLAKRARLVMSHSSGKIEVVGKTDKHIFLRYHRAADPKQTADFLIFKSNPDACWFDDYDEPIMEYSISSNGDSC
ncbi:MAG TPA: KamA family radical SAM protein [Methanosarcinales archaeon]|nr:KamA family radical SAM protein [Methanosarcinales archaeon]